MSKEPELLFFLNYPKNLVRSLHQRGFRCYPVGWDVWNLRSYLLGGAREVPYGTAVGGKDPAVDE
jgi:hypothetical protein